MEEVIITKAETLSALNRAEIDMQIATAKQFPRDMRASLTKLETLVSMDRETAESCLYRLKRTNKKTGEESVIEGLSVRFAEMLVYCWGNIRAQARIIGNDGKQITAQGICHDLESNTAISMECVKRITTSDGRTYSDDMQTTVGNAAASTAFRNAVFKVIPKAVTKSAVESIKKTMMENIKNTLEDARSRALAHFRGLGVTDQQIAGYLKVDPAMLPKIGKEQVMELVTLANSIKEKVATVEDIFGTAGDAKKERLKARAEARTEGKDTAKAPDLP